ncbi:MAG: hypothetical protein ACYC63_19835, partial [Armatimonadota bacterium]
MSFYRDASGKLVFGQKPIKPLKMKVEGQKAAPVKVTPVKVAPPPPTQAKAPPLPAPRKLSFGQRFLRGAGRVLWRSMPGTAVAEAIAPLVRLAVPKVGAFIKRIATPPAPAQPRGTEQERIVADVTRAVYGPRKPVPPKAAPPPKGKLARIVMAAAQSVAASAENLQQLGGAAPTQSYGNDPDLPAPFGSKPQSTLEKLGGAGAVARGLGIIPTVIAGALEGDEFDPVLSWEKLVMPEKHGEPRTMATTLGRMNEEAAAKTFHASPRVAKIIGETAAVAGFLADAGLSLDSVVGHMGSLGGPVTRRLALGVSVRAIKGGVVEAGLDATKAGVEFAPHLLANSAPIRKSVAETVLKTLRENKVKLWNGPGFVGEPKYLAAGQPEHVKLWTERVYEAVKEAAPDLPHEAVEAVSERVVAGLQHEYIEGLRTRWPLPKAPSYRAFAGKAPKAPILYRDLLKDAEKGKRTLDKIKAISRKVAPPITDEHIGPIADAAAEREVAGIHAKLADNADEALKATDNISALDNSAPTAADDARAEVTRLEVELRAAVEERTIANRRHNAAKAARSNYTTTHIRRLGRVVREAQEKVTQLSGGLSAARLDELKNIPEFEIPKLTTNAGSITLERHIAAADAMNEELRPVVRRHIEGIQRVPEGRRTPDQKFALEVGHAYLKGDSGSAGLPFRELVAEARKQRLAHGLPNGHSIAELRIIDDTATSALVENVLSGDTLGRILGEGEMLTKEGVDELAASIMRHDYQDVAALQQRFDVTDKGMELIGDELVRSSGGFSEQAGGLFDELTRKHMTDALPDPLGSSANRIADARRRLGVAVNRRNSILDALADAPDVGDKAAELAAYRVHLEKEVAAAEAQVQETVAWAAQHGDAEIASTILNAPGENNAAKLLTEAARKYELAARGRTAAHALSRFNPEAERALLRNATSRLVNYIEQQGAPRRLLDDLAGSQSQAATAAERLVRTQAALDGAVAALPPDTHAADVALLSRMSERVQGPAQETIAKLRAAGITPSIEVQKGLHRQYIGELRDEATHYRELLKRAANRDPRQATADILNATADAQVGARLAPGLDSLKRRAQITLVNKSRLTETVRDGTRAAEARAAGMEDTRGDILRQIIDKRDLDTSQRSAVTYAIDLGHPHYTKTQLGNVAPDTMIQHPPKDVLRFILGHLGEDATKVESYLDEAGEVVMKSLPKRAEHVYETARALSAKMYEFHTGKISGTDAASDAMTAYGMRSNMDVTTRLAALTNEEVPGNLGEGFLLAVHEDVPDLATMRRALESQPELADLLSDPAVMSELDPKRHARIFDRIDEMVAGRQLPEGQSQFMVTDVYELTRAWNRKFGNNEKVLNFLEMAQEHFPHAGEITSNTYGKLLAGGHGELRGSDGRVVKGLENILMPPDALAEFSAKAQALDGRWDRFFRAWHRGSAAVKPVVLLTFNFLKAQLLEQPLNLLHALPYLTAEGVWKGQMYAGRTIARLSADAIGLSDPVSRADVIIRGLNSMIDELPTKLIKNWSPAKADAVEAIISEYKQMLRDFPVDSGMGMQVSQDAHNQWAAYSRNATARMRAAGITLKHTNEINGHIMKAWFSADYYGKAAHMIALVESGESPEMARSLLRSHAVEYGEEMKAPIDKMLGDVFWFERYSRHRVEQFAHMAKRWPGGIALAYQAKEHWPSMSGVDTQEQLILQGRPGWIKGSLEYWPVHHDFPGLSSVHPDNFPAVRAVEGKYRNHMRFRIPIYETATQLTTIAMKPTETIIGMMPPPARSIYVWGRSGFRKSLEAAPV